MFYLVPYILKSIQLPNNYFDTCFHQTVKAAFKTFAHFFSGAVKPNENVYTYLQKNTCVLKRMQIF